MWFDGSATYWSATKAVFGSKEACTTAVRHLQGGYVSARCSQDEGLEVLTAEGVWEVEEEGEVRLLSVTLPHPC